MLKVLFFLVMVAIFFPEVKYFILLLWDFVKARGQLPIENIDLQILQTNFWKIFWGMVVYVAFLHISLMFNSQFLLPVYEWGERRSAYDLLLHFLGGNHGPLIFVRDGEMIAHYGEAEKKGHGVLLINSNSAAVVGGQVHGPGIVFTEGRTISTVFDLRKQIRSAAKVRAVTRDGIEIETNVSVRFSLSSQPEVVYLTLIDGQVHVLELDERDDLVLGFTTDDFDDDEQLEIRRNVEKLRIGNQEGMRFADLDRYAISNFSQERIQAAHANQPYRPQDGKKMDWRELPLTIAIEEFRNTIVRYPYDDLFPAQRGRNVNLEAVYPLNRVRNEFARRVLNASYLAYYYVERDDLGPLEPGEDRLSAQNVLTLNPQPIFLEYPRPLRQSAISITSVGFGEVVPTSDEVKLQTMANLVARWEAEASRTGVGFDEEAAMIRSRAKAQVQQATVGALAEFLQDGDRARTALILRIFQAIESATAESKDKNIISMVNVLRDMRKWLDD